MFSFGRALGVIEGVTAGFRMNVDWVTPQAWKKHYGLIKSDKNASRAKAQEVFPAYRDLFARAKDDGPAEAALIAMWGVIHAAE
jgi:crossover junction endodeoxyribonuclease RuvC